MKTHHYLPIALALAASPALASSPHTAKTNSMPVLAAISAMSTEDRHEDLASPENRRFRDAMRQQFEAESTKNFADRFGSPMARLHWMNSSFSGYAVNEETGSAGRSLFKSSLRNAARETLAHELPRERWSDWATDLFVGAIGRTAEADIRYGSAAPSVGETAWLQDADARRFEGGLRLDGHAYAKIKIGHTGRDSLIGEQPIVIFMGRYAFDPLTLGSLGFQAVVPLPFSFQIASSCSVRVRDIGSLNKGLSYAVRLQRASIAGNSFGDLFFVGMQSNESFMPIETKRTGINPVFALGISSHSWPWKR